MTSHGRGGEFFGPLIAFIWFFAIIDAVRQAKAINRGYVAEGGFAGDPQLRKAAEGTGSLTWGVILVGLGRSGWPTGISTSSGSGTSIGDWGGPVAIILLGLILIVTHVRKKRRENESGVGMPPRSASLGSAAMRLDRPNRSERRDSVVGAFSSTRRGARGGRRPLDAARPARSRA